MKLTIRTACLLVMMIAILTVSTDAQSPSQKKIRRAAEPVENQYIISFIDIEPSRVAEVATELALRAEGRVLATFQYGVQGFGLEAEELAVQQLLLDPRILAIEENGTGHLSDDVDCFTDPHTFEVECYPNDDWWHLDRIDQRESVPDHHRKAYGWTYTGQGVDIYIVDTGVLPEHYEFDDDGWTSIPGYRRLTSGIG